VWILVKVNKNLNSQNLKFLVVCLYLFLFLMLCDEPKKNHEIFSLRKDLQLEGFINFKFHNNSSDVRYVTTSSYAMNSCTRLNSIKFKSRRKFFFYRLKHCGLELKEENFHIVNSFVCSVSLNLHNLCVKSDEWFVW
jgi:hypothetical protein